MVLAPARLPGVNDLHTLGFFYMVWRTWRVSPRATGEEASWS